MSKIIGSTVGMGLPKPNLMQTDPTKGDYVKGKEEFLAQVRGDYPTEPDFKTVTVGGVRLESSGTDTEPVLELWGAHGDEKVAVGNVAEAETDDQAVPLGQVRQLIDEAMPEGGGGGTKTWRKIAEFTLEEDLEASTWFHVDADNDGTALDLSESLLIANYKVVGNTGNTYYLASKKNNNNTNYVVMNLSVSNNATLVIHCELIGAEGAQYIRTTVKKDNGNATKVAYHGAISNPSHITGMSLGMPAGVAAGTTYEFWGVDR